MGARFLTGSILIAVLLGLAWLDDAIGDCGCFPPGIVLAVLALLIVPLAAIELGGFLAAVGVRACIPVLVASMWAWILACWLTPADASGQATMAMAATIAVGSMAAAVICLARNRNLRGALAGAAATVGSASYLALGLGILLLLRAEHSIWWIAGIIAIIKTGDSAAMFVGCSIGRNPLISWVSPKKTWEGLAGCVIAAAATAAGLAALSASMLPAEPVIAAGTAAMIGAVMGLAGQGGDLVMSVFKRDAECKDSSALLPGLGGVLDVLDSLLLVAVVAWWLLPNAR